MKTNVIYRNFNPIVEEMIYLMDHLEEDNLEIIERLSTVFEEIISYSVSNAYAGNLWKNFLAKEIILNENIYSLSCEMQETEATSLDDLVLHDLKHIFDAYSYDFSKIKEIYSTNLYESIFDFSYNGGGLEFIKSDVVTKLVQEMKHVTNVLEMRKTLADFYKHYGVGEFARYHAFRLQEDSLDQTFFQPISNVKKIVLDDLVGYEIPKQKLIENTEAFLSGKPANNCLLFGDAGTGKSSSVKAILNTYGGQGLRIIEVYKHQFRYLNEIVKKIENRNYKFIIYMDDLSFENFEIEYKYLKAVIEGGLGEKPKHVLIYATSNRRHLIRENYSDKEEIRRDMHTSETVQEKLSLVARFGVSIFFCRPNRKEFQKIVTTLANRYHVQMSEEELLYKANQWELAHGGLSGRTAKQFIDFIRGGENYDS